MIKTIGIVSLSAGTIGEDFVKHEVEIGIGRLEDYGLNVRFLPHARKGIDYVKAHPEDRAADLTAVFENKNCFWYDVQRTEISIQNEGGCANHDKNQAR